MTAGSGEAVPPPDTGDPTTLLLVRHARTAETDSGRAAGGDRPGPSLTAAGVQEAGRLAAALAAGGHPGTMPGAGRGRIAAALAAGGHPGTMPGAGRGRIAAVLTSPLPRAIATAEMIARALDVPVLTDERWTEVRLGEWHGLTHARMREDRPELYRAWQASTGVAPPGGESLDALAVRVSAAADEAVASYPSRTLAVVTHVAPIRSLVARALGAGVAAYWRLAVDPASVTVLRRWRDGGCEVTRVNVPPPTTGGGGDLTSSTVTGTRAPRQEDR